jgi:hypothetical protein
MVLLMCISLFIFPASAYEAETDVTDEPSIAEVEEVEVEAEVETESRAVIPTVEAELRGSLLIIHAASEYFDVEAVYINGERFSYRADTALIIDIGGFVAVGDAIAVYAVDSEGSYSNTVILIPPAPEEPPILNHITPDGQGEVLDHLMSEDNIEFITITTPAGNIFYLAIDHNRSDNNVYFLNPVTEWDLLALAVEAELTVPIHIFEIPPQCDEPAAAERELPITPTSEPTTEPAPNDDEGGGRVGLFIFLAVAGAGAFGGIYYLKVLKPKRESEMYSGDDEEYEERGNFENVEYIDNDNFVQSDNFLESADDSDDSKDFDDLDDFEDFDDSEDIEDSEDAYNVDDGEYYKEEDETE